MKNILILLMVFIVGCSDYINVEKTSKKIPVMGGFQMQPDGMLQQEIILGELPYKIVFRKIKASKKLKKIQIKASIIDLDTKAGLPLCEIRLGKIIDNKIFLDSLITKSDSLGKFTIKASVDTNSVLFGKYPGWSTTFYRLGELVK